MMNMNARQHTLHQCDVCGREVVDGYITSDTILCSECIERTIGREDYHGEGRENQVREKSNPDT